MDPENWFEFSLDVYPDWDAKQWWAVATWGPHPDDMVTHKWQHPKLSVVIGMATAFLLARAAQVSEKGAKRSTKKYMDNPDQLELF
jgi:hypothetical protein